MANCLLCFVLLFTGLIANDRDNEDIEMQFRISNGTLTEIEQYPSMVQVDFFLKDEDIWDQRCAANILTEIFVLSAAHCFDGPGYQTSHRRIRAGTGLRNLVGVVVYVEREFIHPSYNSNNLRGDIVVVQLANPLTFSTRIKPATLIHHGTVIPDKSEVRAVGWGKTSQNSLPSDILLEVTIYTINNELCMQLDLEFVVTENMVCAGLESERKGVCHYDSGGGLFYGNVLIGVISWGDACTIPSSPGVYTAVASYEDWILSTIS